MTRYSNTSSYCADTFATMRMRSNLCGRRDPCLMSAERDRRRYRPGHPRARGPEVSFISAIHSHRDLTFAHSGLFGFCPGNIWLLTTSPLSNMVKLYGTFPLCPTTHAKGWSCPVLPLSTCSSLLFPPPNNRLVRRAFFTAASTGASIPLESDAVVGRVLFRRFTEPREPGLLVSASEGGGSRTGGAGLTAWIVGACPGA